MKHARFVDKVTAFVTNPSGALLLFAHPYAGIQIPAGTVEPGETPETAVLREVAEETGLADVSTPKEVAQEQETLPPDQGVIAATTPIYARPDATSFNWATLRSGINVTVHRQAAGFTQVAYTEHDQLPEPNYVTYHILGWAPNEALATMRRRTFFHLTCAEPTPERWTIFSDNHTFTLFWAPLDNLPDIVTPQNAWLRYLPRS